MRVALMATCIGDTMFPDVPRATVRLLERLGVDVEVPTGGTCCGQPMINTGYFAEAEPLVRNYAQTFADYDAVVLPSGSCTGSVRHQHELVARRSGDAELERSVEHHAPRAYELSEFLVDVLEVTDVGATFPHKVAYHPTCHSLRMLDVGDRPKRLLEAVDGLELLDLPQERECCGFGGTFAVKNADVSTAMGEDKARHAVDSGAEYLVAGDSSCLMQIGGILSRQGAPVQTMHLAEILAAEVSA